MPGSLKTEGIVIRSLRYGEADRILHLYTPDRGRIGAIAKGVRRARSRFGGRLEPFFRVNLLLYEGRSDLLTVTGAETVAAYPRLREDAGALDGAARACEAVARVFDDGDPHAGVYHLLANELALLDREPGRAGRANALAFRVKLLLAAGFAPQLAACASCGAQEHLVGFSGAAGGVVCTACEANAFAARPGGPRLPRGRPRATPRRGAGRPPARARAGRAGDPRNPRVPRARTAAAGRRRALRIREPNGRHRGRGRIAADGRREVGVRLRRGLEGHARAARRQGRQRRRDDPRPRRRQGPRGLHHHHRGVRGLHEGGPGGARGDGR